MLPSAMKDARIMRYGYHSQWFARNAIKQNASNVAPGLLDALKRVRKQIHDRNEEESFERPIIFMAHSFGGLVVLRVCSQLLDQISI